MHTERVICSPEAALWIDQLKKMHGPLMFHLSGGCCDGSQPMCYPLGEFRLGHSDVGLGEVAGCGFWLSKDQFAYLQHTQLCLDVVEGRGSSFSIEIPHGIRFIIRSRLFTEAESQQLTPTIAPDETA